MGQFSERPLPDYIRRREEKGSLRWVGFDSSLDIFPHLGLDWQRVEQMFRESNNPVGDFGSSFSTLPVEGVLRDIDILSFDLMHEYNRDRYELYLGNVFRHTKIRDLYQDTGGSTYRYQGGPNAAGKLLEKEHYEEGIEAAIKKAKDRVAVADLANLPLEDRSLSISIVHDAVPKHSQDLKLFLEKQLPEILRVTDRAAYIYPLSMYKTILWKSWKQSADPETYGEDIWKKVSEMTPEDEAEEKLAWAMSVEDDKPQKKSTLEEANPIYKDPEVINQMAEIAERQGFEFRQRQEDGRLGVFTRKNV